MNNFDVFILIALLIAAVFGYIKGFVLSMASLAGWLLGLYLSFKFATVVQAWLEVKIGYASGLMYLLAFSLCFVAAVVFMHLLGKSIEKVIKMAALGFINRLAGALLGILKISLFLSALFYLIAIVDRGERLISPKEKDRSVFYRPLSQLLPDIIPLLQHKWNNSYPDEEQKEEVDSNDENSGQFKV
ncbi:Colicin V production protein [anaerobic digester metagenome]|nr:CvpA family protein [Lentimicrobiaceae bacterium]